MPVSEERVSNNSLQRQITELATRMEQIAKDIVEIKQVLRSVEERVRSLENAEAGRHPLIEARIDAAWRKIEEHDRQIHELSTITERLAHANKLLAWFAGITGSTVIVWLITQILPRLP